MEMIPRLSKTRQSGFTLLELLVVLVIMAIGTAMAMISMGILDPDKDVAKESRRLKALLQMAQEQAIFQGRSIGLEITNDNYRFFLYDRRPDAEGNMISLWVPMTNDEIFKTRELPDDIVLELLIDDRDIQLPVLDDDEAPAPQILMLSSGDMSNFEIYFYREAGSSRYLLSGDSQDGLSLEEPGDSAL